MENFANMSDFEISLRRSFPIFLTDCYEDILQQRDTHIRLLLAVNALHSYYDFPFLPSL